MSSIQKIRVINAATVLVPLIWFASQHAEGQEVLRVRNDMNSAVNFWLLSEQNIATGGKWVGTQVRRGETKSINLVSPDRYLQAVTDQEGAIYYNDPLPLRQLIQQDPNMTLVLDGELATQMASKWVFDQRRRLWFMQDSPKQVRIATIFVIHMSNGLEYKYYAGPSPRR